MFRKNLLLIIMAVIAVPVFAQQIDYSLIPYRKGDLWGYSNEDKKIVIKLAYAEAKWFSEGYAAVKMKDKFGYINKTGKVVIPFKFYDARSFRFGYFDDVEKHTADGKTVKNKDTVLFAGASLSATDIEHCIDTAGRIMSKCPAINENSVSPSMQLVSVSSEKVYTLVNNGNLYDKLVDDYQVEGDAHTYYIGIKNNRFGVINNTFDVVVPFEYDSLRRFADSGANYIYGSRNGKYGVFRENGQAFVPFDKTKLVLIQAKAGYYSGNYYIETNDGKMELKGSSFQNVTGATYKDITYDAEGAFILTTEDNNQGAYMLNTTLIAPKYKHVKIMRGGKFLQVTTMSGKMGYVSEMGEEYFSE